MKNKIVLLFFVLLIGIIFISRDSFAGWTQAKGHSYHQLTYGYYISNQKYSSVHLGGDNEHVDAAKFRTTSVTYYGEYGIVDALTVFTSLPWKEVKSDDTLKYSDRRGPSGIGDIDFGLRYNLSNSFLGGPLSLQGTVKIPEAYDYGHPLSHLSLGDGQYDAMLALVYGKGFSKGYAVLNAGYKYRFKNAEYDPMTFKPSDQIKFSAGGEYNIFSNMSIGLAVDWTRSVGNASVSQELIVDNYKYGGRASEQDNALIRDSLALEQQVLNLGASLGFNLSAKARLVLSYAVDVGGFWIFQTKDAGTGETYNAALAYSF